MWVSSRGAAGQPPTSEQMQRWRRRISPPENEFPAAVGLAAVLGRTDDAAVGITQLDAYSTGFRFRLAVRLRQVRAELVGGGLYTLITSHVRPGLEISLQNRLLLGIEYPDGRRISNLQDTRMQGPAAAGDGTELVLAQQGGGGDERSVDQDYWLSPLPADGPVAVVLAWPGFGIPESRTVLDGGVILAAAARSTVLWPPQQPTEPAAPPPPPRPSSGWFAQPPD